MRSTSITSPSSWGTLSPPSSQSGILDNMTPCQFLENWGIQYDRGLVWCGSWGIPMSRLHGPLLQLDWFLRELLVIIIWYFRISSYLFSFVLAFHWRAFSRGGWTVIFKFLLLEEGLFFFNCCPEEVEVWVAGNCGTTMGGGLCKMVGHFGAKWPY